MFIAVKMLKIIWGITEKLFWRTEFNYHNNLIATHTSSFILHRLVIISKLFYFVADKHGNVWDTKRKKKKKQLKTFKQIVLQHSSVFAIKTK